MSSDEQRCHRNGTAARRGQKACLMLVSLQHASYAVKRALPEAVSIERSSDVSIRKSLSSADHQAAAMAQPSPQEVEAQAYAFRQLVQHLQNTADDAQNIDVMSVAGMCRNCVAKWLHRGFAYAGDRDASYDRALEVVYGEPYPDWKKKHQKRFHHGSRRICSITTESAFRSSMLTFRPASATRGSFFR